MNTPDEVTIRPAASTADYLACQDAQRRSWGITDDSYIVPLATLVGANLHGGLVLGAFRADGSAVGLSFAFLGKVRGRLCLYSQLTGIVPEYQGQRLGLRLKHAQRDWCREQGIDRIAWSFDPLQGGNAHFNLNHLGAVAVHYIIDMYGQRSDALNAGVATDRLIAEWDVTQDAETRRTIAPGQADALIEIPADITTLRRDDPPQAEAWTETVRQAFTAAFAAGQVADGFLRDDSTGRRRCYYVLHSLPKL